VEADAPINFGFAIRNGAFDDAEADEYSFGGSHDRTGHFSAFLFANSTTVYYGLGGALKLELSGVILACALVTINLI
jgi:hypothetical protein